MSAETIELAHRIYEVFNRHDWDGFVALLDEEVVIASRLVVMEGGYKGHEGARRWWDDILGAFPDYTLEIKELRDLGDVTLGDLRGTGHAAVSESPISYPFWHPIRWREGKCVLWANYETEAEALEAVG